MRSPLAALLLALASVVPATAAEAPTVAPLGAKLERYDYPYPVAHYAVASQGRQLDMAYMDLAPAHPNGRVAVLLHGKNFCGPYWIPTAERLRGLGWRVVIPDQVGFCKSDKPGDYQYSIHQLAANTHALLESLGVAKATVIAHSMGGMIGARYALMFPAATDKLVLVDPLGLEDWRARGVPWHSVDQWYQDELKTSYDSIKAYQLKSYYAGQWKSQYDRWALLQAGMYAGPGRQAAALAGALTYDMLYTQPVLYEFPLIRVPTTLIVGDQDRTAIGKAFTPAAIAARLGDYPTLAREAAARIPGARLILLPGLGHAPMLQAPARFDQALDQALAP